MGQYLLPFFFKKEASLHALHYVGLKLEPSGPCFQSEKWKQSASLSETVCTPVVLWNNEYPREDSEIWIRPASVCLLVGLPGSSGAYDYANHFCDGAHDYFTSAFLPLKFFL